MIICSFVVFLILLLLYKKWQKTLLGENKNAHTENILPHCAVCCPDILWHFFKIMLSKLRERSTKFTWVTNKQNIVYFLPKAPHLSSLLFSLLTRVLPRFFDQVGHETMYAFSGNKQFSLNLVIIRLIKIMNQKNLAQC